jgi:hypothetical protein
MEKCNEQSIGILREALAEAQATVRAYDTKAQIVGVGYVFSLGIVGTLGKLLPTASTVDGIGVMLAWGFVILPVLLFGFVLYPSRKTAPRLDESPERRPEFVLYIDTDRHHEVEGLKQAVARCDPFNEYAFEVLKLSKLRELKRKRFLRALFLAAVAFCFLFATQLLRSQGIME